jgi:hypothetical protein
MYADERYVFVVFGDLLCGFVLGGEIINEYGDLQDLAWGCEFGEVR